MHTIGIIPARYDSSRFPGKPLIDIMGKTMIQRVYEQALKAKSLDEVFVATDDDRIFKEVEKFGGKAMMTSTDHLSGTDRCNEVVSFLASSGHKIDVVVNIQGDEPYIQPEQIEKVCSCFSKPGVNIATLAKRIENRDELFSNTVNKVIFNKQKNAIYFSRTPIPYMQNQNQDLWHRLFPYYKHIGIYAYRTETLLAIASLEPAGLEKAESLEQLRWLENGYSIRVEETHFESIAIDTPADLLKITNKP